MSTHDDDESDHGTAIALALVGGGAVLLWWLLRGRGKGWGGFGRGSGGRGGGHEIGGSPPRLPAISVKLVEGDRILLDRSPADLETTLARARVSSQVHLSTDGAVRAGFVSKVLWSLLDAEINVDADWDLKHRTPRVDDPEGKVITVGKIFFFDNPTIDKCLRTRPRKECIPDAPGDKITVLTDRPNI